ncbi:transposase [Streptomyces sp. NPDC002838]|uniref:transposase n=1 Tax=Streptomyces sp. NPDC002838 TaxID=3154436 RepID=UPI0033175FC1
MSRCPVSVRPRSGEQVPSLTAQVAGASNPRGTTAIWVRDGWTVSGTTRTSRRGTRATADPGHRLRSSPPSACLLNLSDRQAAEAVRCRIDFKYALALKLDDPGFHHSVLSDFRDRLVLQQNFDA